MSDQLCHHARVGSASVEIILQCLFQLSKCLLIKQARFLVIGFMLLRGEYYKQIGDEWEMERKRICTVYLVDQNRREGHLNWGPVTPKTSGQL